MSFQIRGAQEINNLAGQAIDEFTSCGDSKAKGYAIIGRIADLLEFARLANSSRDDCVLRGESKVPTDSPIELARERTFMTVRAWPHSLSAADLRRPGGHMSVTRESSLSDNRARFPQADLNEAALRRTHSRVVEPAVSR
jgi:hypothetical protein